MRKKPGRLDDSMLLKQVWQGNGLRGYRPQHISARYKTYAEPVLIRSFHPGTVVHLPQPGQPPPAPPRAAVLLRALRAALKTLLGPLLTLLKEPFKERTKSE